MGFEPLGPPPRQRVDEAKLGRAVGIDSQRGGDQAAKRADVLFLHRDRFGEREVDRGAPAARQNYRTLVVRAGGAEVAAGVGVQERLTRVLRGMALKPSGAAGGEIGVADTSIDCSPVPPTLTPATR